MSPTGSVYEPLHHSFLAPPFADATVVDAMRVGLVSCPPDTSLKEVARMMATYRIHSVLITDMEGQRPWGIVSDLELATNAGADLEKLTALDVASTDVVTVAADDRLSLATRLMAKHRTSHLVVIQPHSGHPVGVLSTLDVAGVLAWGGTA